MASTYSAKGGAMPQFDNSVSPTGNTGEAGGVGKYKWYIVGVVIFVAIFIYIRGRSSSSATQSAPNPTGTLFPTSLGTTPTGTQPTSTVAGTPPQGTPLAGGPVMDPYGQAEFSVNPQGQLVAQYWANGQAKSDVWGSGFTPGATPQIADLGNGQYSIQLINSNGYLDTWIKNISQGQVIESQTGNPNSGTGATYQPGQMYPLAGSVSPNGA